MSTTSAIVTDINNFVTAQNHNRGQLLASGTTLPLDYDALTGTVPSGGNSITGISGIASGAAAISLPTANGNAAIVDGGVSAAASTSGADSYSLLVSSAGAVTLTDNNTGNSEAISGASYILFNGAATTTTGAYQSLYIIETGVGAEIASMYNAAFGRVPDLAGLEFYIDQFGTPALPDLHTAATYFMASPEFKTLYPALQTPSDNGGANDKAFITELYGNILHRTPTAAEVNFYVEAVQGALTTSSGAAIPAADRATLLEYFAASPENQADISASNGGWLINPANGAVNLGAMSSATATTVIASEAASGTINGSTFSGLPSNGLAGTQINGGYVSVEGDQYYSTGNAAGLASSAANVTLDLTSQYYAAFIEAANITVNGPTGGGSLIVIENIPIGGITGTLANAVLTGSGTVNLAGNSNWIEVYTVGSGTMAALPVTTIVNGWNSTDLLTGSETTIPGHGNTMAALGAQTDGVLYQGNSSSPVSGASLGSQNLGTWFSDHQIAINVGPIASDSVAAIVAAANQDYKVADIGTVGYGTSETAYFFGQDPHGNTLLVYWRGDSTHAGTVLTTDIVGVIELVGVQASSLTSANFHL